MPYQKILIKPGIQTEATPLLNEGGFSKSQLIRFFQGFLQKIGGWQKITSQAVVGKCRGMLAWSDLQGVPYVACGTDQRVEVYYDGQLYDITPVRKVDNVATPFSTISTSTTVQVTDTNNGAQAGDTVYIVNEMAVGGIVLQGYYTIGTIIDSDNYDITALNAATATVSTAGAASNFAVTMGFGTVTVTLPNHGYAINDVYTVYISTTVGGITLSGPYLVETVPDANTFTFTAVGAAASTANAYENTNEARLQYLIPSGLPSAMTASGWGEGGWGLGPWGEGSPGGPPSPLRQWSMLAWGQDWIGCPTNGGIYVWDPSGGVLANPATIIAEAPPINTGIFLSMPYRQVVAYGCYNADTSVQDPLLIKWCDVDNFHDWTASAVNQAGSFRLSEGSTIVGAIQGPTFGMIWTDLGLWQMQYINFPLVYGFNKIGNGCGLISMRACGILAGVVYWMSQNSFYRYSGNGVENVDCSVWDKIFQNLNAFQKDKICMGVNSHFNEFFIFYPSLTGTGENDLYVKYSTDGFWDYGSLTRLAWVDQSAYGNPLAVDDTGFIYQHESGEDADGAPIVCSATTGWFKISDGTYLIFLERMIGDFVYSGGNTVQVTVETVDYPNDTPSVKTFNVTKNTEYNIIRLRGRFARITVGSSDLGSFWRLGELLYLAAPAGRR